jgi:hypothetical protein
MDRHLKYGSELTQEKQLKAGTTVQRINQLIARMRADGIDIQTNPNTQSAVSSGWRPAAINANTAGAAVKSKHMTCEACDLYDPDGEIDEWALANPDVLADLDLWQEHPSATKGWAHFQTVPPRSGNRVFYP